MRHLVRCLGQRNQPIIAAPIAEAMAWLTKRSEAEAQQLAQDRDRRQNLYKQFIDEASRMYADALSHDEVQVSAFVNIYALISRMRVISRTEVVAKAEKVASVIANAYSSPN